MCLKCYEHQKWEQHLLLLQRSNYWKPCRKVVRGLAAFLKVSACQCCGKECPLSISTAEAVVNLMVSSGRCCCFSECLCSVCTVEVRTATVSWSRRIAGHFPTISLQKHLGRSERSVSVWGKERFPALLLFLGKTRSLFPVAEVSNWSLVFNTCCCSESAVRKKACWERLRSWRSWAWIPPRKTALLPSASARSSPRVRPTSAVLPWLLCFAASRRTGESTGCAPLLPWMARCTRNTLSKWRTANEATAR